MKTTDLHGDLLELVEREQYKPTPRDVRAARELAGLSQKQAAELMQTTIGTWIQWETSKRQMHQRTYELFVLLTQCSEARVLILKIRKKKR